MSTARNQQPSRLSRRLANRRATSISRLERSSRRRLIAEQLEDRRVMSAMPLLESYPAAPASLYLDFDGHYEATWGQFSNISIPAYDSDGNPAEISAEEATYIEEVWKLVAEDFASLNINVTTIEPPELAAGVPQSQANGVAMRIAIGGPNTAIPGLGTGVSGYAYRNAFTNSIPNVAFVFPEFSSGTLRTSVGVGNTASHEAAHAFGLAHVSGTYDRATQWEAIMQGFSQNLEYTTWTAMTTDEGNFQDDLEVMARPQNGFGYRPDDHGDSTSSATPLTLTDPVTVAHGIVGAGGDVDVFRIDTATSRSLKISVEGSELGQNLDAVFDFLDASGNVLVTVDPSNSLDAEWIVEAAGTHYVAVRSTGQYARIGQYTMRISESDPGIRVNHGGELRTSEQGQQASFLVSLKSKPTADVQIPLVPSDPTEVALSTERLTFTPENWFIPQTVTLTGVDDADVDGLQSFSIGFAPAESADPRYAGMQASPLAGTNLDDDFPGSSFMIPSDSPLYLDDIAPVSDGGSIVTGQFRGSVDFDLGPGVTTLTSASTTSSAAFVARYSATGELLWARQVGSEGGSTSGRRLVLDSDGNIFVVGSASGSTVTIGSTTAPLASGANVFLTKLSPIGEFQFGTVWSGIVQDIAVGPDNLLHVAGSFSTTVDFDPGAGTATRTSLGSQDGFVSRFTPDGTFLSVTTFGGSGSESALRLAIDAAGNAYVAGRIQGTAQIGSHSVTSPGNNNQVLVSLNTAGDVRWVRHAEETGSSVSSFVTLDSQGGVHWAGLLREQASFTDGNQTQTFTSAALGVFLTRWDTDGNLLNAQSLTGSDTVGIRAITSAPNDQIYIVGAFSGSLDADPSSAVARYDSAGASDAFLLRMNTSGDFQDFIQMRQEGSLPHALTTDARGNVYFAGYLTGYLALPTGETFTSDGYADGFAVRLNMAPGISVSRTVGLVTTESGGSASFDVVLDRPPSDVVSISFASSNPGEGTVSATPLVFTPQNWNVPQSVTVVGADDTVFDRTVAYEITAAVTSADPDYDGLAVATIHVTNEDNDPPPLDAYDNFSSGGYGGGSGWLGPWSRSGDVSLEYSGAHSSPYHARLRRSTGDLTRVVDTSQASAVRLSFWSKLYSFEGSDRAWVKISENGSTWTTIHQFADGDDTNQYRLHEFDIPVSGDRLYIRFDAGMSNTGDYWYIDDVRVAATAPANASPVATGESYVVAEDGTLTVVAGQGVLANDFDPEGDPLVASVTSGPAHGSVTLAADGSFVYVPSPDFHGSDSFVYSATDSHANSTAATVTLSVTPSNDAPTATPQTLSTLTGTALAITLSGSDVDGDSLSYTVTSGPSHGTLSGSGRNLTYTPAVGFAGADSFTFQTSDGHGGTAQAVVSITVEAAPVEVVLFADSFEGGGSSSNWSGRWYQDSQNDFFRSTQRSTDGSRSAEVDGSANNAVLVLASPLDLTGYAAAELTFDWLIESGFDSGEYVALDVSTNGGGSWQNDVRRLRGNVDSENRWHSESVDLSAFASSNVLIRFRAKVSSSSEDANIDNVRIIGVMTAPPPGQGTSPASFVDAEDDQPQGASPPSHDPVAPPISGPTPSQPDQGSPDSDDLASGAPDTEATDTVFEQVGNEPQSPWLELLSSLFGRAWGR